MKAGEKEKIKKRIELTPQELERRVQDRTAELKKVNAELRKEVEERKWAEEALCVARDDWENIFESIYDPVLVMNRDRKVIDANQAAIENFGISREKISGCKCSKLFGCDGTPCVKCPIQKVLNAKEPKVVESEMNFSGSIFSVTVAPVINKQRETVKIIHIARDITDRKEVEAKLLDYQKQLQKLASELSLSEERLRRNMATELHDMVGQNLALAKMKLGALGHSLSDEDAKKELSQIKKLLDDTIQSTRSLTFELSPPVLYELGFGAAMEWLVRRTRKQHGIEAEFNDEGLDDDLNIDICILLFQAVRELLINTVKHANAKNIEVSAKCIKEQIEVTVTDDGIGLEISKLNRKPSEVGRFGLFNIRQRLNHIGGALHIHSKPGEGTSIIMTAPVSLGDLDEGKDR
jgi:PAS domain S-box-containing protein